MTCTLLQFEKLLLKCQEIQGISKRLFPGSVKSGDKVAFRLPSAGRKTQFFHHIPGKSLLEVTSTLSPLIWWCILHWQWPCVGYMNQKIMHLSFTIISLCLWCCVLSTKYIFRTCITRPLISYLHRTRLVLHPSVFMHTFISFSELDDSFSIPFPDMLTIRASRFCPCLVQLL